MLVFCPNCGARNREDAIVCHVCGKPLLKGSGGSKMAILVSFVFIIVFLLLLYPYLRSFFNSTIASLSSPKGVPVNVIATTNQTTNTQTSANTAEIHITNVITQLSYYNETSNTFSNISENGDGVKFASNQDLPYTLEFTNNNNASYVINSVTISNPSFQVLRITPSLPYTMMPKSKLGLTVELKPINPYYTGTLTVQISETSGARSSNSVNSIGSNAASNTASTNAMGSNTAVSNSITTNAIANATVNKTTTNTTSANTITTNAIAANNTKQSVYGEAGGESIIGNNTALSIGYTVNAIKQNDTDGCGPVYTVDGFTNAYYWYSVGLAYNGCNSTGAASGNGFRMAYTVAKLNTSTSASTVVYTAVKNFSGAVNASDKVLLELQLSGRNVTAYAKDLDTGVSANASYSAGGSTAFASTPLAFFDGLFTGVMTEWYHSNSTNGLGMAVGYAPDCNLTGPLCNDQAWLWTSNFGINQTFVTKAQTKAAGSPLSRNENENFTYNGIYVDYSINGTVKVG